MSPDALVRKYFEHRATCDSPAGQNIVAAEGRVYADRCGSVSRESRRARGFAKEPCPGRSRHANSHGVEVCARCGDPWRFDSRQQLSGEVKESKRFGVGGRTLLMLDLGLQLQRFVESPEWRWPASLYVATIAGRSVFDLVKHGPTLFPECPHPWNPFQVVSLVNAGRAEWQRRCREAGLTEEKAA